jgi:hypothetical protein
VAQRPGVPKHLAIMTPIATEPLFLLRFYHKFTTEGAYDVMTVEISISGGPWTRLDSIGGAGANFNTDSSYAWYDNTSTFGPVPPKFSSITTGIGSDGIYSSHVNGWIQSAARLTGAAGQSDVKFRFHFSSDVSGNAEGWALDDIELVDVTAPTTGAAAVVLSNVNGTSTGVNWTNGNGDGRLVVARQSSTAPIAPLDNVLKTENSVFGAQDSTGLGNYVIYNNTGNSVVATGLTTLTDYTYDVYEYNGKYMHVKYAATSASNNATTLPVAFTSFTVTPKNSDVLLAWSTASEINNRGFEVERSVDGRNFEYVNFVKGAGNSSRANHYDLTDKKAFDISRSNVLYYRLKQTDFDGKFVYSTVVRVNKNQQALGSLTLFPNPYATDFSISLTSTDAGKAVIEMMDIQGKVVASQETSLLTGSNTVAINNASDLNAGVYFVRVTLNGETQMLKLVKN